MNFFDLSIISILCFCLISGVFAGLIGGLLAQGIDPYTAVHEAQEYTWETLKNAYRIGMGQFIPNRLFWARSEETADV